MKDPFVEEIRNIRKEHAYAFQCDLRLIAEDLKKFEVELGDRVVHLPPKRRSTTETPVEQGDVRLKG